MASDLLASIILRKLHNIREERIRERQAGGLPELWISSGDTKCKLVQ